MSTSSSLILLLTLISQVYTAPQFITFKDGKLGVNFGGYHAAVGIGGLLDGTGTSGGLYAEAGTPTGQLARAGLGGSVDEKGGASGGLFAGATAGGNVKASAGLAGGINAEKSVGGGYASAQAGNRIASSSLGGDTVQGSIGIENISTNDDQQIAVKPIDKKTETEFNIDSINEVNPIENSPTNKDFQTKVEVIDDIRPAVVVKEVYVEPQPQIVDKQITQTHDKPRRQHFRKTAFLGGYIGPGGEIVPPSGVKTEPAVLKRVDVGVEASTNIDSSVGAEAHNDQTITKQVTYQRNPSFFQDIFNIPISALKAVGNFLSNTAANTNVSVQKSASVQAAETDTLSAKHEPPSLSSSSAHISVETPSASKLIDDIFAIPINTLGAVNKFLDNNVASRKSVQIRQDDGEPQRVRRGPHARRRANKQIVILQEAPSKEADTITQ